MAHAFIVPFVLYLLGTNFISAFGDEAYPIGYTVVALVVAASILFYRRGKDASGERILKPHWNIGWGVLFGVIGLFLWLGACWLHLESYMAPYLPSFIQPGKRVGYNPFEHLSEGLAVWSFIAVRLVGIAVIVPIAEELFWRGFLLRWLIDPEWKKIKLGEFTYESCGIVVLMFTLAHPEWLAAATWCLLINGLLYWKKDLWQCVVAHAVTNLLLAIYVLNSGHWWLW
ncbi:MAG: CAAX prenyl protease-related protein [Planctomycetota bacterium]